MNAAFPHMDQGWDADKSVFTQPAEPGMTMRQYYAGVALQALIIGRSWEQTSTGMTPEELMELWARSAHVLADKMIAEGSHNETV